MLNRPTRHQIFMSIAHEFSKRATCMRLNVGAVIVADTTIIAHGYNGAPSGEPHCLGNSCPGKEFCQRTVHAEENAIKRIPAGIGWPLDLYTTDSPCFDCCGKIHSAGVSRVFFDRLYRITTGMEFLASAGVEIYRITAAGYVLRWPSMEAVEL